MLFMEVSFSQGTPAENANESENVVDVEGGGADGLVVQSRLSIENENKVKYSCLKMDELYIALVYTWTI